VRHVEGLTVQLDTGISTESIIRNQLFFFLRGTFAPFFLAFDRPIAIACFRLLALPFLPLRCVPFFVFLTAFFTSLFALAPYLAIMNSSKRESAYFRFPV
jgi:hypothetical protein